MNGSLILIICIPLTFLVIYLAFLSEENRLLKIIYQKLSHLNPIEHKRVLTSLSKSILIREIIKMLVAITDKITFIGSVENEKRSYQKMEELVFLYAKMEDIPITVKMSRNSRIGCLKNINRILDKIIRIKSNV